MNPIEEAKKTYEGTPISENLSEVVGRSIKRANKNKKNKNTVYPWIVTGAAALLAGVVFTLNINTALANDLKDIPIIASLVRLVTIESYKTQTEDMGIIVEVPSIEDIQGRNPQFTKEINGEISEMCHQYAKEAEERALEYRKAFLETGGTLEDWKTHNIQIVVDYEVKSQKEEILSFVVYGTENWTSAYGEHRFYNLDLGRGEEITLASLLGEEYISIANQEIKKQIEERNGVGEESFFTPEEGGFTTIGGEQSFYINEKGNPVIVFDKYTVAPGYMGMVEFEIDPLRIGETTEESAIKDTAEEDVEETDSRLSNFNVDATDVTVFVKEIQVAVEKESMEDLGNLIVFPTYISIYEEGGGIVNTKEEFLKIDERRIFTKEIKESIQNADLDNLNPSMAGYILTGKEGGPSIEFSNSSGMLGINGINY